MRTFIGFLLHMGDLHVELFCACVGAVTLELMSKRLTNWTSCWFHTNDLNRQYLFLFWIISFKSTHLMLIKIFCSCMC